MKIQLRHLCGSSRGYANTRTAAVVVQRCNTIEQRLFAAVR